MKKQTLIIFVIFCCCHMVKAEQPGGSSSERLRKELSWAMNGAAIKECENTRVIPLFDAFGHYFERNAPRIHKHQAEPTIPAKWVDDRVAEQLMVARGYANLLKAEHCQWIYEDPEYIEFCEDGATYRESGILFNQIQKELMEHDPDYAELLNKWRVANMRANALCLSIILEDYIYRDEMMPTSWIEETGLKVNNKEIKKLKKHIANLEGIKPDEVK